MELIAFFVAFANACLFLYIVAGLLFWNGHLVVNGEKRVVAPLIGLAVYCAMSFIVAIQVL